MHDKVRKPTINTAHNLRETISTPEIWNAFQNRDSVRRWIADHTTPREFSEASLTTITGAASDLYQTEACEWQRQQCESETRGWGKEGRELRLVGCAYKRNRLRMVRFLPQQRIQ